MTTEQCEVDDKDAERRSVLKRFAIYVALALLCGTAIGTTLFAGWTRELSSHRLEVVVVAVGFGLYMALLGFLVGCYARHLSKDDVSTWKLSFPCFVFEIFVLSSGSVPLLSASAFFAVTAAGKMVSTSDAMVLFTLGAGTYFSMFAIGMAQLLLVVKNRRQYLDAPEKVIV